MNARDFFVGVTTAIVTACYSAPVLAASAYLSAQDPGSQINIRSEPTTDSYVVDSGSVGDSVQTLDQTQGYDGYTWYRIRHSRSGSEGWVRGDLIRFAPQNQPTYSPPVNRSSSSAYLSAQDPGSQINIRSEPTTDSYAVNSGSVGDSVQTLGQTEGYDGYTWYRIRHSRSGSEGWVRGDLIRFNSSSTYGGVNVSTNTVSSGAYLFAQDPGSQINIRSEPTTDSYAVNSGSVGDSVQTLDQTQGYDGYTWYRIRHSRSGSEGWVRGDLIRFR